MVKQVHVRYIKYVLYCLFFILAFRLYYNLFHPRLPPPLRLPFDATNTTRTRAAFVILLRNSDLDSWKSTMRQLENRLNKKYNYPYIFLNNEEFTAEFKEQTQQLTMAECYYGLVPHEHWGYPDWIDQDKAKKSRDEMEKKGIIYGESESYRHMCRFESGFFFRHPLLKNLDYYWRVEPDVDFYCNLDFDPFAMMERNGKKYAFTISLYEFESTIHTLWRTVRAFIKRYPKYIANPNSLAWLSDNGGVGYNLCHFWSNFEIASLEFLRSDAYMTFFEYLDKTGGFFYERWGDAPVHSIAAALFLKPEEIHFFNEIGYRHPPFTHCPLDADLQAKCDCDAEDSFDFHPYSCTEKWLKLLSQSK